jgi:hypothetical protein
MNMREWTAKVATIVVILSMPGALALSQRETTILRTVRGTVVTSGNTAPFKRRLLAPPED